MIVDSPGRLDAVLVRLAPHHSRSRWAQLIRDGHVTVDGDAVRKPSAKIYAGQRLGVDEPPPVLDHAVPQDLPISLVYEDAELAVVNKAAGMVVHPGAGHPKGTLVNALLFHLEGLSGIGGTLRPGIVHRLDKGTSGLLVVAKTDRAHRHLSSQFADHTAGRVYTAICVGKVDDGGTITSNLARHPRDRVKFASTEFQGKRAVTHFHIDERMGPAVRVICRLETGRTHQIRVHLSENGLPLVGDPLYGRARVPPFAKRWVVADRPMLHAGRLSFVHPVTLASMRFEAPLPADMVNLMDLWRIYLFGQLQQI